MIPLPWRAVGTTFRRRKLQKKLNEKVAEGMINISMNTAPYFEDSTAEGNLMIVNESINNYPQKVQIVRNDTGEQIYESGAIAVGSKIEHAKLDAALPAGTYECTAYFHNLTPKPAILSARLGPSSQSPSRIKFSKQQRSILP